MLCSHRNGSKKHELNQKTKHRKINHYENVLKVQNQVCETVQSKIIMWGIYF